MHLLKQLFFYHVCLCLRTTLQRDLFSADRLLQTALLHVQQLCEAACSSHHQQVDTGSRWAAQYMYTRILASSMVLLDCSLMPVPGSRELDGSWVCSQYA